MKLPKGMGGKSPEEPKKPIKPEILDHKAPIEVPGMTLEEWEDTPADLRTGIKDPYYTEDVEDETEYVDEEWDGSSESKGYITGDALSDEVMMEKLRRVMELKKKYREKEAIYHPERFGLPDFMREQKEGETLHELVEWRKKELKRFLEEDLYHIKGGKKIYIKVTPVMLQTVYDVLYKVHSKFLIWKGRGCGGSFCTSIIVFLVLIYHHREVVNMAGCLLPDELVQTSQGFSAIKDLHIGDKVTSLDGTLANISDFIEKDWDGGITHLIAKGYGQGLKYTSDHRLLCVKNAFPYIGPPSNPKKVDYSAPLGEVEWCPIGDLTENDGLAIPLPQQHGDIPKIQYGLPSSSAQRWATNPALECVLTPEHCRFLGYWLAEGHIDKKNGYVVMSFGESDEFLEDLPYLTNKLFSRNITLERNIGENGNEVRYRMGNKVLCQWLSDTFGTGASNKTIPLEFLDSLPDEHLEQLLIGFIRGDGSYTQSRTGKVRVNLGTTSQGLISAFHRASLRLKLFPNITKSEKKEIHHKDMWFLTYDGEDAYRLANLCFPDNVHKHGKFRNKQHKFTETHVITKVKSTNTYHYKGKVYDITVPDGTSFGVPLGHAHNSKRQSAHIYEYVSSFWDCFPKLKKAVLADDPLVSKTSLKTGAQLECITCSESAARGDHPSCLIIDEMCLVEGTKVLTSQGILPVEQLKVGDLVINDKGKYTPISKIWSQNHEGPFYKVVPAGYAEGGSFTYDHPIYASTSPEGPFEWVPAGDLTKDHWLYTPISEETPYLADIPYANSGNIDDFCRFLGYFIGDGWVKKRDSKVHCVFNSRDVLWGEDYTYLCKKLFNVEPSIYRSGQEHHKNTFEVIFKSEDISKYLLETFGDSAITKNIPADIVDNLPNSALTQFIVGYCRADGSIYNGIASSGGRCRRLDIRTSSYGLASTTIVILNKLGILPSFREVPSKISKIRGKEYISKPNWCIDVNGEAMEKIASLVHSNWDRKSSRNNWKVFDSHIAVPIKEVAEIKNTKPVWDITVPDGNAFMCGNMLVHNCQGSEKPEKVMESAISSVTSEDDPLVIGLSTFHHPIGLFQEYWDSAEEKGFKCVKWDVFDAMAPCKKGMEYATPEDPMALEYCKTKCPFSWTKEDRLTDGTLKGMKNLGCHGKARNSTGFMSYDKVFEAHKMHKGTQVFEIEYACERPDFKLPEEYEVAVGIDWGYASQTAIVVCIFTGTQIVIPEVHFMTGKSIDEVIICLMGIRDAYGDYAVFADEAGQFNNRSLQDVGFPVYPVGFKNLKELGISNILRFLMTKKMVIDKDLTEFITQLKSYKRNKLGKPVKKDDHSCDALCAAMLNWFFSDTFPDEAIGTGMDDEFKEKIRKLKAEGFGGKDDGTSVTIL